MSEETNCTICGMAWTPPHLLWQVGPGVKPCNCGGNHSNPAQNERTAHAQGRHNYRGYTKAEAEARAR